MLHLEYAGMGTVGVSSVEGFFFLLYIVGCSDRH